MESTWKKTKCREHIFPCLSIRMGADIPSLSETSEQEATGSMESVLSESLSLGLRGLGGRNLASQLPSRTGTHRCLGFKCLSFGLVVKSMSSGSERSGFESWLCHCLALGKPFIVTEVYCPCMERGIKRAACGAGWGWEAVRWKALPHRAWYVRDAQHMATLLLILSLVIMALLYSIALVSQEGSHWCYIYIKKGNIEKNNEYIYIYWICAVCQVLLWVLYML